MNKYENLEGQSRRQNHKFYNMREYQGELWNDTENKVRNYTSNDLGIERDFDSIE